MIDEYEAELAAYAQLTAESRQPLYAWIAMGARTTHTVLVGLLDETESLAQQTLAMGRRMDRPGVFASYGIQMYLLRYLQGRIGEVEASTRANLERRPQHHPTRTISLLVGRIRCGLPACATSPRSRSCSMTGRAWRVCTSCCVRLAG